VEHLEHRAGDLDEHGIVQLTQTEQLEDLLDLGAHVVDTADTDHNGKLGLRGNKERTIVLGGTTSLDHGALLLAVLLDVLLRTLEDLLAGSSTLLTGLNELGLLLLGTTGLGLLALQEGLRDGIRSVTNMPC
jgi:hypothetical protein